MISLHVSPWHPHGAAAKGGGGDGALPGRWHRAGGGGLDRSPGGGLAAARWKDPAAVGVWGLGMEGDTSKKWC